MTAKWKEVSAYTGEAVEEDAPTNFAGQGSGVDFNPTGMKKKKKKSLLDARTKSYKEHKAKLEAARLKRLESKKSKFVEKVKESVNEFNRESFLVEDNLDVLKDIVKRKQNKSIKFKDGSMKVDLYTASAVTQVFNAVNKSNQQKITKLLNGSKAEFMKVASFAMSKVK